MPKLVTDTIELLRPYEAGKPIEELARELGVTDAVKLASNENPRGPSPRVLEAIQRAAASINRYPDAAAYRLRERLAEFHGVRMDEIVQGAGSNELIDVLVRAFTTPEKHVVFAEPSFVCYRMSSLAQGTPFTAVPLKEQTHDLQAMADAVEPCTALVFVANPNNPTGTHVPKRALEAFLRRVPPEVIVVIDEAYLEYGDAPDYPDSLTLRGARERLVVLRTFSKVYALAALRIGYAVGPAPIIDYMNRLRLPFNCSSIAQEAALAALADTSYVASSREENGRERTRLSRGLAELGAVVTPSQANFVFATFERSARELYEALLRKGVIVRAFASLPHALRITVGTPGENTRFLSALGEVLS
ncbi:MAG TPA: histidinol-phosphate transaminase [Polyangiaceae bacterium]|nr:histidinol-phosphate transaminase [Polyangiaceae bacterium]